MTPYPTRQCSLSRDADLGCCGRPTDAGIEPPAGANLLRVDGISGDPLMWLETKGNCNLTGFSSTEGADKVVEQNFRVDVSQVSLECRNQKNEVARWRTMTNEAQDDEFKWYSEGVHSFSCFIVLLW